MDGTTSHASPNNPVASIGYSLCSCLVAQLFGKGLPDRRIQSRVCGRQRSTMCNVSCFGNMLENSTKRAARPRVVCRKRLPQRPQLLLEPLTLFMCWFRAVGGVTMSSTRHGTDRPLYFYSPVTIIQHYAQRNSEAQTARESRACSTSCVSRRQKRTMLPWRTSIQRETRTHALTHAPPTDISRAVLAINRESRQQRHAWQSYTTRTDSKATKRTHANTRQPHPYRKKYHAFV